MTTTRNPDKSSLRREYDSLQAERRSRYIENLLKEAILNVLAEQQQTPKPPPPPDPNVPVDPNAPVPPPPAPAPAATPPAPDLTAGAPPAAPTAPPAAPEPVPAPDMSAVPAPAPGGQPGGPPMSVTALVDSLNVIRGGKSLTDPEVLSGISTVFKSLTAEQKQELNNILNMLSKAVEGTEPLAPETQGVPTPALGAPPPPPPAPPPPAGAAPPIAPTGI